MRSVPTNRRPITPGTVLQEDYLNELNLSQNRFAQLIRVNRSTINDLVNDRNGVSAEMAVRLSKALGTTPQYWLNLQAAVDLFDAVHLAPPAVKDIMPIASERGEIRASRHSRSKVQKRP